MTLASSDILITSALAFLAGLIVGALAAFFFLAALASAAIYKARRIAANAGPTLDVGRWTFIFCVLEAGLPARGPRPCGGVPPARAAGR